MSIDYLTVISEESSRLADLLRAGPLDAPVAGCPGWNLGDLGIHMVGVQRWSAEIIRTGEPPEANAPAPNADEAADALVASSQAVVEALSGADPAAPCWNFTNGPQVAQFWFVRQACEIAVHRWDGESAVSDDPQPLDPAVAAAVIDEFLHSSMQRVIDRDGVDLTAIDSDVHVHCTDLKGIDAPGEWTFEIVNNALSVTDEHRKAAVALRGPASDLALLLYGRIDVDQVEMFGEPDALAQWNPLLHF